ncbi:MAG: hypothetical protein NTV06_07620, partial [candidate division Zixibacteria bacterium]|nr:hypothetical protein [candidate division Zixibacteria bacterium]
RPDIRYSTWRPIIFGVGIDDLKSGRLGAEKFYLACIHINPEIRFKQMTLTFNMTQWLPLSKKLFKGRSAASSSEGTAVADKSNDPRWKGFGFSASLNVQY